MMEDKYISIAEYAKRTGVSRQSVYKRLTKDLAEFVNVVDGKKWLSIAVLQNGAEETDNQVDRKVDSEVDNGEARLTELTTKLTSYEKQLELYADMVSQLTEQNKVLVEQIKVKDSQIEALTATVNEQQQTLSTMATTADKQADAVRGAEALLAKSVLQIGEESDSDAEREEMEKTEQAEAPRHWWQIFKRK